MRKSLALAVLLVLLRAAPWVLWEQAHFDSDQATAGLMALHASEGRAFPLVHYGQYYMLGVDTWLAAPLFRAFGPSVTALKLPLVAINVAVVVLLILQLRRVIGLSPPFAFLAALFVVIPPPVVSSRLVEAQGSSIEVFLYVLLLWMARSQPFAFGAIAGFGFMHREFTLYAVAAIVVVAILERRASWRAVAAALATAIAVPIGLELLKTRADLLGPGSAGTYLTNIINAHFDQSVQSRLCWNPREWTANLQWLFTQNLGVLFGWRVGPLSEFNLNTRVAGGHLVAAAAIFIVCCGASLSGERKPFALYLILVGLQAIGVYAFLSCVVRDGMLVRYTLLGLLLAVGAAALALSSSSAIVRAVTASAIVVWALAAATDDVLVLREYLKSPPRDEYRELTTFLESQGIRFGMAPFWTAYHVDFLSHERVILGTWERIQIAEYQDLVKQHANEAVRITVDEPCPATAMAYR